MEKPFLRVLSLDAARDMLRKFGPLETELVPVEHAVFRVLAESLAATEDTPSFDRSTMDGFAVRSWDTFGASEAAPAFFRVVGEAPMGEIPSMAPAAGEAVRIWTGGALPSTCDAVVMVEHSVALDGETVEILKAVAPYENVVRKGEDFRQGETLLRKGLRLRPQDLGFLAAMGHTRALAYRTPTIALISSGDEIVPIEAQPPAGCMRDVNRYTLTAMVAEAHAKPVWIGIAADRLEALSAHIDDGIRRADVVVVSGGSSMGSRDLVIEAIKSFRDSELLFHGVSISPGKPLIFARIGGKPVLGLPGHPVSAMVCFEQFVVPLIRRLEGEDALEPFARATAAARLSRNVPSREGRTDYVRVRLDGNGAMVSAVPVTGKSGMISAMVRADGFIRIEADCEGLYRGDRVTVHLFSEWLGDAIEKKHLSGHESPRGGVGAALEPPRQERLSRV
jgi:molybdopterin molybdotransferase